MVAAFTCLVGTWYQISTGATYMAMTSALSSVILVLPDLQFPDDAEIL